MTHVKKRLTRIALTGAFVLSLAACGGTDEASENTTSDNAPSQKVNRLILNQQLMTWRPNFEHPTLSMIQTSLHSHLFNKIA